MGPYYTPNGKEPTVFIRRIEVVAKNAVLGAAAASHKH